MNNKRVMESLTSKYEVWQSNDTGTPLYYIKYYGKGWWRRLLFNGIFDSYYSTPEDAYDIVRRLIEVDNERKMPRYNDVQVL